MDLLGLLLLMLILGRVTSLDRAARVTEQEFRECLSTESDPGVVAVNHRFFWLFGAPRNRYITHFKGHRVHCTSFRPLEMPADVALVSVVKL